MRRDLTTFKYSYGVLALAWESTVGPGAQTCREYEGNGRRAQSLLNSFWSRIRARIITVMSAAGCSRGGMKASLCVLPSSRNAGVARSNEEAALHSFAEAAGMLRGLMFHETAPRRHSETFEPLIIFSLIY